MSEVYIYADESCLGNGKASASPGGAAGVVQVWNNGGWVRRDYWLSDPDTTNNRMAIRSAIEPLHALKKPSKVIFTSDSQYLVKGCSEWIHGWIRKSFQRKGQGPVENRELWEELIPELRRHEIEWRWVRGHAGHPMNEFANWRAMRAAREQTRSGGLVASQFEAWIENERAKGRYLDFHEFAPPPAESFRPTRKVPAK